MIRLTQRAVRVWHLEKTMEVAYRPEGIYLPEIDLWLDPRETVEHAWISHGHSDHARGRHARILATEDTLRFYRMRWPEEPGVAQSLQALNYGESVEHRGARLTAYPAGHILGAAQLAIEYRGERLVYTGDLKLRPPLCGTATEPVRCHRLILEATFGLPIYHFLDREAARARIAEFARATLADGGIPVFLGYALGRGQEIAQVLGEAGVPYRVHGAIAKFLPAYAARGYAFGEWSPYESRAGGGAALVVTPGLRRHLEATGRDFRVAYVSGWAALANARARAGAEELIPYSDHADFAELLELAAAAEAERVDLVHGYTEPLARILRARGYDAHAAGQTMARDEEAG